MSTEWKLSTAKKYKSHFTGITGINYILIYIQIEKGCFKCYNTSQFYCIFDQMNTISVCQVISNVCPVVYLIHISCTQAWLIVFLPWALRRWNEVHYPQRCECSSVIKPVINQPVSHVISWVCSIWTEPTLWTSTWRWWSTVTGWRRHQLHLRCSVTLEENTWRSTVRSL